MNIIEHPAMDADCHHMKHPEIADGIAGCICVTFELIQYALGPAVYDIHSPNIPSETIDGLIC